MPLLSDEESKAQVARIESLCGRKEAAAGANSRQVGGDHYRRHGALQHWDVVAHFGLDYFQGQITKYVMRWKDKGGLADLEKARHFLDKYIELERANERDRIPAPGDDEGTGDGAGTGAPAESRDNRGV